MTTPPTRIPIPTALTYVFLAAGGLWQVLGVFRTAMAVMAGPLISGLAVAGAWLTGAQAIPAGKRGRFAAWAALVVSGGWLVERLGVATGIPFGRYRYGPTLRPQVQRVPLAIGFAWLGMLLSSLALAQRLLPGRWMARSPIRVAATATLMLAFDRLMEPAAVKLGYWTWEKADIPVRNYLAWWVLGAGFAALGLPAGVGERRLPAWVMHSWLAQALYFLFVYAAPDRNSAELTR